MRFLQAIIYLFILLVPSLAFASGKATIQCYETGKSLIISDGEIDRAEAVFDNATGQIMLGVSLIESFADKGEVFSKDLVGKKIAISLLGDLWTAPRKTLPLNGSRGSMSAPTIQVPP